MARTATVGPEVFARVTELVKDGKSRTEAFAEVAKERNSRPGTVAANYYRVARQRGQGGAQAPAGARRAAAGKRPTAERGIYATQQRRSGRATPADGDVRQTARQITELVEKLVNQVEERDRRLREALG